MMFWFGDACQIRFQAMNGEGRGLLVEVDLILDLVALLQVLRPGCE